MSSFATFLLLAVLQGPANSGICAHYKMPVHGTVIRGARFWAFSRKTPRRHFKGCR